MVVAKPHSTTAWNRSQPVNSLALAPSDSGHPGYFEPLGLPSSMCTRTPIVESSRPRTIPSHSEHILAPVADCETIKEPSPIRGAGMLARSERGVGPLDEEDDLISGQCGSTDSTNSGENALPGGHRRRPLEQFRPKQSSYGFPSEGTNARMSVSKRDHTLIHQGVADVLMEMRATSLRPPGYTAWTRYMYFVDV